MTFLFDFDGTIADSFENFLEVTKMLSKKYQFPNLLDLDIEKLREEDARTLIKKFKIPVYKIPFIARDMKKLQQQKITQIKPIQGLTEVLMKLKKKNHCLGIITTNSAKNVELFLDKNKLAIFDFVHGDTSLFGKDKAILRCFRTHKLKKEEVIYVGDEIRDVLACQKIGVQIAAVSWGYNSVESLKKYHPDFVIENPDQLTTLHISI